ncbi:MULTISPECIES: hypothetical protein [Flavobacteriaceae]|uniref:hypothetical protein n=1 Tax=Flavobacteriaceae TaxID=49546 RepID=UPI00234B75F4|nr:hypothetical protein [Muricauda sp. SP22]MDC6362027.1 hypothetical protein [Muricauda sp. SP22]
MKKVFVPILVLVACSLFSACNLDDDTPNFYFTTLAAVEAEMPESFELNQTYNIKVTYLRPNGCTFFEGFDVTKLGETDREVVVVGSVLTDDDTACTEAVQEVEATLPFRVIFTGEYNFKFYAGQDANDEAVFLEYTVPVDEAQTN